MALGLGLLYGPRGVGVLMGEVPLYGPFIKSKLAPRTTRWSTRVSLGLFCGVFRDQLCTTYGPKVNCVRQVDF